MAPWLLVVAIVAKILAVAGGALGAPAWFWMTGIFGPDLYILFQLFWPTAGAVCPVIKNFAPLGNEVWLTIDDGPDPVDTPRNLRLLAAHGAKATFFLIGARAAAHPELVQEILRQGHQVGHHTQTHPSWTFWCASPRRVARELDDALAVFQRLGARPSFFRPPVGIKNLFLARLLATRDLRCAAWSIRSYDSVSKSSAGVIRRVAPQLRPGAIILLHEGAQLSPQVRQSAVGEVLQLLATREFRCVLPALAMQESHPVSSQPRPQPEQCSA